MQIIIQRTLEVYVTKNSKKPFIEWLEQLDDVIRYRIKEKLDQVMLGNLGDHKFLEDGIFELRLNFGSGYRIYYGVIGRNIILLLCGGNKSTQRRDIKKATAYWQDYLSRQI
jgi:putative addiction module killer protein